MCELRTVDRRGVSSGSVVELPSEPTEIRVERGRGGRLRLVAVGPADSFEERVLFREHFTDGEQVNLPEGAEVHALDSGEFSENASVVYSLSTDQYGGDSE